MYARITSDAMLKRQNISSDSSMDKLNCEYHEQRLTTKYMYCTI